MEKVPKGLPWPVKADTNAADEEWEKAEAMARLALPLLPGDPQGKIKREHGIILPTYEGGPRLRGYIDLAIPPGIGWPAFLVPSNEAIVGDYKTLSDFRYMKTPEELANSVQMMTYAKWAISEGPDGLVPTGELLPEHVRLLHMYAKTRSPYTRNSIRNQSAVVSVPEINSFWDKTLDIVREMQQTASCTNADDVDPGGALNGHCEAYGGCYFRDKCGLAKESGIKSLFQINKKPLTQDTNTMSGSAVLAKILAARAAASSPTTQETQPLSVVVINNQGNSTSTGGESTSLAASAVAATGSISTQPSGPISGLLAKIEAQGKGKPALGGSVAQAYGKEIGSQAHGYAGTGEAGASMVNTVGELMKLASGVIPPDAPSRSQPAITTPGTPVVDPEADVIVSEEDSEAKPEAPEVKRRGRPSKEEMQAREAAEKAAYAAKVEAEVTRRLGSNVPVSNVPISGDTEGLTIYVDCLPVKGHANITDFHDWIQPATQAVAESNGVPDWRMINYTSKALLATQVRELIKMQGLPQAIHIPSFAGGADIALEILSPLAKKIIRPIR